MDSQRPSVPGAGAFETAASVLRQRESRRSLTSSLGAIDEMTGGFEPGVMYLFYGSENVGLADAVLHHTVASGVRGGGDVAVAEVLQMNRFRVWSGDLVDYLYVDAGTRTHSGGLCWSLSGTRGPTSKYRGLVRQASETLLADGAHGG